MSTGEPKPGTFVKGDPRINRSGGPRGKQLKPPALLRDMRAVYSQHKSKDKGPAQKELRKMLERSTERFVGLLGRLEQGFQAELFKEEASIPVAKVDIGDDKAKAVLTSLLEKYYAKLAQEDAEFAKRPDAMVMGATLQQKLAASLEREAMLRKQIEELRGASHA